MRIQIIGIPRGGTSYIYDVVRRYHNPLQLVEFGNEPFHPTLYVNDDTDVTNFYKKHINDIRNTFLCFTLYFYFTPKARPIWFHTA